jgi:hypothetical protein
MKKFHVFCILLFACMALPSTLAGELLLRMEPIKQQFTQGEPVILNYTIDNRTGSPQEIELGAEGSALFFFAHTRVGPWHENLRIRGGFKKSVQLEPNEIYHGYLLLDDWFQLTAGTNVVWGFLICETRRLNAMTRIQVKGATQEEIQASINLLVLTASTVNEPQKRRIYVEALKAWWRRSSNVRLLLQPDAQSGTAEKMIVNEVLKNANSVSID